MAAIPSHATRTHPNKQQPHSTLLLQLAAHPQTLLSPTSQGKEAVLIARISITT